MMVEFPGDCAERFRPVRLLAEGGYGAVHLVEQIGLDRMAVVKLLHGPAGQDPLELKRFVNEARITAAIVHPHVVRVLDHGAATGVPWIAFEYLEGRTLRARLEQGALGWQDAVAAASQVASALEAAHALSVLHRDIKPENIIEASLDSWKVADFGIAKWSGSCTVATEHGTLLGTPWYMAPEQVTSGQAGASSDVYALGVTLFELVTGVRPFDGDGPIAVLTQHVRTPAPLLRSVRPSLPASLESLVQSVLAKDPAGRPTAGQLHRDLEDLRAGEEARPASRGSGRAGVPRAAARSATSRGDATAAVYTGAPAGSSAGVTGAVAVAPAAPGGSRRAGLAVVAVLVVAALFAVWSGRRTAVQVVRISVSARSIEASALEAEARRLGEALAKARQAEEQAVSQSAKVLAAMDAPLRSSPELLAPALLAPARGLERSIANALESMDDVLRDDHPVNTAAVSGRFACERTAAAAVAVRLWVLRQRLAPAAQVGQSPKTVSPYDAAHALLGVARGGDAVGLARLERFGRAARASFAHLAGAVRPGPGGAAAAGPDTVAEQLVEQLGELHDVASALVVLSWDGAERKRFRAIVDEVARGLGGLADPVASGLPRAAREVWTAGLAGALGAGPELDGALAAIGARVPAAAPGLARVAKRIAAERTRALDLLAGREQELAGVDQVQEALDRWYRGNADGVDALYRTVGTGGFIAIRQLDTVWTLAQQLGREGADGNGPSLEHALAEEQACSRRLGMWRDLMIMEMDRPSLVIAVPMDIDPRKARPLPGGGVELVRAYLRAFSRALRLSAGAGQPFPARLLHGLFDRALDACLPAWMPTGSDPRPGFRALFAERLEEVGRDPRSLRLRELALGLWDMGADPLDGAHMDSMLHTVFPAAAREFPGEADLASMRKLASETGHYAHEAADRRRLSFTDGLRKGR